MSGRVPLGWRGLRHSAGGMWGASLGDRVTGWELPRPVELSVGVVWRHPPAEPGGHAVTPEGLGAAE